MFIIKKIQKKILQFFPLFLLSLSSLFFIGTLIFKENKTVLLKYKEHPVYFAPPHLIQHFSFGFSELYADTLWLRLLQDIDFCSHNDGIPNYTTSKNYHCQEGWSYKITDIITELAPRFLKPYQTSGSIMSVIMQDKMGAKKILDKGVKRFPKNWKLNLLAGYHYLLELDDQEKSAKLFLTAAENGGPNYLYTLSASLYSKEGKFQMSYRLLKNFLKDLKPNKSYEKIIRKRLQKLEQKMRKLKIHF